MDGWIDGWIDRERHGQAVDGPYGSSRGTHNYPSPDAARSHAHSAADLCPTIYFMPPRPPRLAAGPCNSCGGRERGGGAGAPSKVGHALVSRQAPARASLSGGGGHFQRTTRADLRLSRESCQPSLRCAYGFALVELVRCVGRFLFLACHSVFPVVRR